jgi:hypothetical protein
MNLSILPALDAAQQPRDGVLLVGFGANSLQHVTDDIRGALVAE